MRLHRPALLTAASLLAVLAAGCSRDTFAPTAPEVRETTANERTADPAFFGRFGFGISGVMFVHASPDAPAVDIKLGLLPAARGLEFAANTPYRFTWSGLRTIRVNVAGTATTVIQTTARLQRNTFYTVFAADRVANIGPVVLVDDLTPPAAGKAHVRFVHLSPDAPAVDVALANGGPVLFGNRTFKQSTDFAPLAAGTYDLEVRVAGTNTVALSLPGVTLKPGRIYTVYAKGLLSGSGPAALGAGIIVNYPDYGYAGRSAALAQAQADVAGPSGE